MTEFKGNDDYYFSAEFYDHVGRYRERRDVEFFVQAARESGGPVLEVCCGTGRVLIPTARAGIAITGVDASPAMLKKCREKLKDEPQDVQARVTLGEEDMRRFDFKTDFALVTIPFRPFQHLLTVEDQLACLACIRRHLKSGGRFILDVFNPSLESLTADDLGREQGAEPVEDLPDGRKVVRRTKIISRDRVNQIIRSELVYYVTRPDGREERAVQPLPMRYLFRYEAEHLLARSGFTVESVYADYDKTPFGEKYPGEIIMIARA
jgi:SAM-dependent methyltransferase